MALSFRGRLHARNCRKVLYIHPRRLECWYIVSKNKKTNKNECSSFLSKRKKKFFEMFIDWNRSNRRSLVAGEGVAITKCNTVSDVLNLIYWIKVW